MSGPYNTERDAAIEPMPRHIAAPHPSLAAARAVKLAELLDACTVADVALGDYDRRVIEWLAGWEPTVVQVVADLIRRAARAHHG